MTEREKKNIENEISKCINHIDDKFTYLLLASNIKKKKKK